MATEFPDYGFEPDGNSVFITVKDLAGGDNPDKVYEALSLKMCPTGATFDVNGTDGNRHRKFIPWHNIEMVSQQLIVAPV